MTILENTKYRKVYKNTFNNLGISYINNIDKYSIAIIQFISESSWKVISTFNFSDNEQEMRLNNFINVIERH
jgi:hypothetical protein